jgi:hypothetical protein
VWLMKQTGFKEVSLHQSPSKDFLLGYQTSNTTLKLEYLSEFKFEFKSILGSGPIYGQ